MSICSIFLLILKRLTCPNIGYSKTIVLELGDWIWLMECVQNSKTLILELVIKFFCNKALFPFPFTETSKTNIENNITRN